MWQSQGWETFVNALVPRLINEMASRLMRSERQPDETDARVLVGRTTFQASFSSARKNGETKTEERKERRKIKRRHLGNVNREGHEMQSKKRWPHYVPGVAWAVKPLGLKPSHNFFHVVKYFGNARIFSLDDCCVDICEIALLKQKNLCALASVNMKCIKILKQ